MYFPDRRGEVYSRGGLILQLLTDRQQICHYYASRRTTTLNVKCNNIGCVTDGRNRGAKEAAKTRTSEQQEAKSTSFPLLSRCSGLPLNAPLSGSLPSPTRAGEQWSPCGAGYHYVYSLELKCHIMTQLGGPYNLCP